MLKHLKYLLVIFISCIANLYSSEVETPQRFMDLCTKHAAELKNTTIYQFITVYDMENYATNLAKCMDANRAELDKFEINSKIRIICDGRNGDLQAIQNAFSSYPATLTNTAIDFNETNEGCSRSRYIQLQKSISEVQADISSGKHVYFTILDGDDMVHKDLYLLMATAMLEKNADAVFAPLVVKCNETDSAHITDNLIFKNIFDELVSIEENSFISDFTVNLFKSENLFNNFEDLNKDNLVTLAFELGIFYCSNVFQISFSGELFYNNSLNAPYLSELKSDTTKAIPMYYYMQNPKSLEHNLFLTEFKKFGSKENMKIEFKLSQTACRHISFRDVPFFILGYPELLDRAECEYAVNIAEGYNTSLTRELLLEKFKYNHVKLRYAIEAFLDLEKEKSTPEFSLLKYDFVWLQPILDDKRAVQLLQQDLSIPLSDEFLNEFYGDFFDEILLGIRAGKETSRDINITGDVNLDYCFEVLKQFNFDIDELIK